jgi:hypothetical protein
MATAKLEYNLDDNDDQMAHLRAVKSLDLVMVLWDMDGYLRAETKYAPDSINPEVYDTLQSVRDKLHEIMSKYSINLDELIQ